MNRDLLNPGLLLDNPNRPPQGRSAPRMGPGPGASSTGTVEERVKQVLDRQINPAVASPRRQGRTGGGPPAVVVSLRLSGGCQGCGQAAATLRNGIEVALRQHIPEITEIIDVTDHASGENPYISA